MLERITFRLWTPSAGGAYQGIYGKCRGQRNGRQGSALDAARLVAQCRKPTAPGNSASLV